MIAVASTKEHLDLALQGKLAIDRPRSKMAKVGHLLDTGGFSLLERKPEVRHLVPVAVPPKCETCVRGSGAMRFEDGVPLLISAPCPDCVGGYPIGQEITLTVPCGVCEGSGRLIVRIDHGYLVGSEPYVTGAKVDTAYWHSAHDEIEDCWQCHKACQVPRCVGVLREVLPIEADGALPNGKPHMRRRGASLYLYDDEGRPTDMSHLGALCGWPVGWFGLVLVGLKEA